MNIKLYYIVQTLDSELDPLPQPECRGGPFPTFEAAAWTRRSIIPGDTIRYEIMHQTIKVSK